MERTVIDTDNRDENTTWLWISNEEYVEVRINELIENALENLGEDDESQVIPVYGYHTQQNKDAFFECIRESIHQGMDGWSEVEKSVITRYLRDICVGVDAILLESALARQTALGELI